MKKVKGAIYAGIVLLVGVVFAYVRFLTPYLPSTYNAGIANVLFNVGGVDVTIGTVGAIIFLIIVVGILVWYRRSLRRSH
jgi:type II secretory pathway component PulF